MTTRQYALSIITFTLLLIPGLSNARKNSPINPGALKPIKSAPASSEEVVTNSDLLVQLKQLESIIKAHSEQVARGQEAAQRLAEQAEQDESSRKKIATIQKIEEEINKLRAQLAVKNEIVINNNINVAAPVAHATALSTFTSGASRLMCYILRAVVLFGPSAINYYLINQVFCLLKENQALLHQLQQTALQLGAEAIPVENPTVSSLGSAAFLLAPLLLKMAHMMTPLKQTGFSFWPGFLDQLYFI